MRSRAVCSRSAGASRRAVLSFGVALAVVSVIAGGASGEPSGASATASELQALSVEELMQRMASTPGVAAAFVERKELRILSVPIESRGVFYFIPPNRLARYTTSPGVSSLVVDGDRMAFRDEAGGDVDLSGNPLARVFVDNMIVLWSGDLAALRRRYEVAFDSGAAGWSLTLVPSGPPMKEFVAEIRLRGDGTALREMVMVETDGDQTRTDFDDIEVDRRFSDEEQRRVFSSEGPLPER